MNEEKQTNEPEGFVGQFAFVYLVERIEQLEKTLIELAKYSHQHIEENKKEEDKSSPTFFDKTKEKITKLKEITGM